MERPEDERAEQRQEQRQHRGDPEAEPFSGPAVHLIRAHLFPFGVLEPEFFPGDGLDPLGRLQRGDLHFEPAVLLREVLPDGHLLGDPVLQLRVVKMGPRRRRAPRPPARAAPG